MKTIATIAIIGLASALRIREDPDAEFNAALEDYEMTNEDFCAMISSDTYENLKATYGEEEAPTREEFDEIRAACNGEGEGSDHGTDGDHGDHDGEHGDDKDHDGEHGDDADHDGEHGDDKDHDDGEHGDHDDHGDHDGEHGDDKDHDGEHGDDKDHDDEHGDDKDHDGDDADHDGEHGDDEDGDDEEGEDEEFAYYCNMISQIPEDTPWPEIEAGLAEEFGDELPSHEDFVAFSWACEAAAHDAIEDFESVCAMIAETFEAGVDFHADVEPFLIDVLGSDSPGSDEWDAILGLCFETAEEHDAEQAEKAEATTKAQIKDEELTEKDIAEMLTHCADIDLIVSKVGDSATWDEISAAIVAEFGADEAPTQEDYEFVEQLCIDLIAPVEGSGPQGSVEGSGPQGSIEGSGPGSRPANGSAAQKKDGPGSQGPPKDGDSDGDDSEDDIELTEEEEADLLALAEHCHHLDDLPEDAEWSDIEDEFGDDEPPTKEDWDFFTGFCRQLASLTAEE